MEFLPKCTRRDGLTKIQKLQQDDNVSDQIFVFLRYMTFFLEYSIQRIRLSTETEERQQLHYHKLWHENNKIKKEISVLSASLEDQRNIPRKIGGRIKSQHLKNIELVETINKKCCKDAKSLSMKFERLQIDEYKRSEARQNDLNQILSLTKNKIQNLSKTNERLEREIYSKRFKVISQYSSLTNRYDSEIGGRQIIIGNLKSDFNALNEERRRLEDIIEQQEVVFNFYIHEIRANKIREFTNRLKSSRIVNAARTIQQWWRSIVDKRKLTKKRKGKKKKKKHKKFSP